MLLARGKLSQRAAFPKFTTIFDRIIVGRQVPPFLPPFGENGQANIIGCPSTKPAVGYPVSYRVGVSSSPVTSARRLSRHACKIMFNHPQG